MKQRHAILVGVNDYDNASGLTSLKYAERDAEVFGDLLQNLFNYNVSIFTGTSATRENILNEFLNLSRISSGEKFVFFFAGHGQTISDEYFLHPIGAKSGNDVYSIRMNRVLDYFEKSLPHKEIIGIIDACHKTTTRFERGDAELDHFATKDVLLLLSAFHYCLSDCF